MTQFTTQFEGLCIYFNKTRVYRKRNRTDIIPKCRERTNFIVYTVVCYAFIKVYISYSITQTFKDGNQMVLKMFATIFISHFVIMHLSPHGFHAVIASY